MNLLPSQSDTHLHTCWFWNTKGDPLDLGPWYIDENDEETWPEQHFDDVWSCVGKCTYGNRKERDAASPQVACIVLSDRSCAIVNWIINRWCSTREKRLWSHKFKYLLKRKESPAHSWFWPTPASFHFLPDNRERNNLLVNGSGHFFIHKLKKNPYKCPAWQQQRKNLFY